MHLVNIALVFNQYKDDEFLKDTIKAMKDKWIFYFSDILLIYLLVSALDSTVRITGTRQLLEGYYNLLEMTHISVHARPT